MNGRMTAQLGEGFLRQYGPQWSRPMNGRMTLPGHGPAAAHGLAAMEPADERPDDDQNFCGPSPGSPAAAMEPADERPDDPP